MSFYDIQYPYPQQQKQILADFCSKQAKDNLNANLYVGAATASAKSANVSSNISVNLSQVTQRR
jgi:hypothetical protein